MCSKYEIAKKRADEIDSEILQVLQSKKSFRVEAGAGSGKTYSLNKVITWMQDNYWDIVKAKKQKVACITYTNASVDVIASRLKDDSFIQPMTIHSFAWELIRQFEKELKQKVFELQMVPQGVEEKDFDKVQYELGVRYVEDRVLYLYHDDVIALFAEFMNNVKFRRLLALQYPIILIDEYQDSLRIVIDQFLKWYINENVGPQFCFFGDAWQTIYDKSSCGLIESQNLVVIGKESNFRSQQVIVDVLNRIRPELPQIPATDENDGVVKVITCNDYQGERQNGYYKGELPNEVLSERIANLQKRLDQIYNWNIEGEHITLMITHKMLAKQQKYANLLNILDERLKDGEDPYLKFFDEIVEPLFSALESKRLTQLFDVLKNDGYPIEYKKQKHNWNELMQQLEIVRQKTIRDVVEILYTSKDVHVPIPPKIQDSYNKFLEDPDSKYGKGTIGAFYNIPYSEVLGALAFLRPDAEYSTDHGVKGEEYDNVLFVIGRGWNNYQFDKYMGVNLTTLQGKEYESYIRNRNLFYVCCSRPKKRLILFVTIPVEGEFLLYLQNVFGQDNICSYEEFMGND